MVDSINVVLLIIIAFVIYSLTTNTLNFRDIFNKKEKTKSKIRIIPKRTINKKSMNTINVNQHKYGKHDDQRYVDDILNDTISWDNSYDSSFVKNIEVNKNFIDTQFHNDYRDVLTAFNNLVPDRKQLFNIANIPLVYSEPEAAEVKNLVTDFISTLNHNITTEVPRVRNKNSGWDELIPEPKTKSGWEQVQSSLGLPESLYEEPANNAKVLLVDIPQVQKYETEDEVKYSIELIIQKVNVDDQLLVKGDFVQDKRPLLDENNFFTAKNIEMKISIENLFITGYLSKAGDNGNLTCGHGDKLNISSGNSYNINDVDNYDGKEMYYDYNKLEYNNMTDPNLVQQLLMEKYKKKNEEMEQRTAMLDSEGQAYHGTLPNVYEFDNIKNTQSIYDDMNYPRLFS